jgi:hypothetical protein
MMKIRSDKTLVEVAKINVARILYALDFGMADYKGEMKDHWFSVEDEYGGASDLFSAFHRIQYGHNLKGCVTKLGETTKFKGNVTLKVHDDYNFSDPKEGIADRKPFETVELLGYRLPKFIQDIEEEEFRQLELHDYTKGFPVDGEITRKVTIIATGKTIVSDLPF